MKKLMFLGLILMASQAHAGLVSIPGCPPGQFTLVADTAANFENGPTNLNGNVLVTQPGGHADIGAFNQIHGTVIAETITVPNGAVIDKCVADTINIPGTGICTTQVLGGYSAAPAACKVPPFNLEPVDPCVDSAADVNVPNGGTLTLAPGCYGAVKVGAGGTLTLQPGGAFKFLSLRTGLLSHLTGPAGSPRARIVTKLSPTLSAGSRLTDVDIFSQGTVGSFQVGNSTDLIDTLLVAAGGTIHLHTGTTLEASAAAAVKLVVQPISSTIPPPNTCACDQGLSFVVANCPPGSTCAQDRACQ